MSDGVGASPPSAPPTPSKSDRVTGFFDALLKKDSSTPAASVIPVGVPSSSSGPGGIGCGPSASPEGGLSAAKSKGGKSAPSMEDLQLLMEQLSALSQSLADSQMANVELQQTSAQTQELYDQMKIERDFTIKKVEQQEKEMQKLKDKMSFSALDATNEQLKQLKIEAAELQKESEALKQQNRILYQNYADINAELQTMHDDSDLRLIELKQLGEEKSELELARDGLVAEQVASGAKCSDLESELAALQAQASADRLALESSQLADAAAARDSLALQLASEQALLHEAITERNRCKKMTESVQTEMQKLVAQLGQKGVDRELLVLEAQRLREDLARKSKSLSDALTALGVAMETQNFAPQRNQHETFIIAPSASGSKADQASLQKICNSLIETITEKDNLIGVLRKQCVGLGKRVIELEAGTLPDFSEKGVQAMEELARKEEEERKQAAEAGAEPATAPAAAPANQSTAASAPSSPFAAQPHSPSDLPLSPVRASGSSVTAGSPTSLTLPPWAPRPADASSDSAESAFPSLASYAGRSSFSADKLPASPQPSNNAAAAYLVSLSDLP